MRFALTHKIKEVSRKQDRKTENRLEKRKANNPNTLNEKTHIMEIHVDPTRFEYVQAKIREGITLDRWIAYWKFHNLKTVFTSGVFDNLDPKGVQHLCEAAQQGDVLIVGIPSDQVVKARHDQTYRSLVIAGMECVEAVVIYDEADPGKLIEKIQPSLVVEECR